MEESVLNLSDEEFKWLFQSKSLNETIKEILIFENGGSLIDAVNMEVEEETGIILSIKELEPFVWSLGYYRDWPEFGKNRKIEIYYEIKPDEKPNLVNTKYKNSEKEGNFELRYIPIDDIENN